MPRRLRLLREARGLRLSQSGYGVSAKWTALFPFGGAFRSRSKNPGDTHSSPRPLTPTKPRVSETNSPIVLKAAATVPGLGERGGPAEHSRWFSEQVHPHDAMLKSYLRNSFPSVRDVDDVVQESYLRIWKARARQSIDSAKAFLFQIARHVATDLIRHERCSPIKGVADLGDLDVFDSGRNAVETACTVEEIALLADAIEALPHRCREVFVLRKLKRVSQREIAHSLGLSEQTVQVQIQRGMKRCEAFLARRGL